MKKFIVFLAVCLAVATVSGCKNSPKTKALTAQQESAIEAQLSQMSLREKVGLHLIRHHTLGGLERRVQGFRAHAEKLAHFFPQAHLGKLSLNGILLFGGESGFLGSILAPGDCQKGQAGGQKDERLFHGE